MLQRELTFYCRADLTLPDARQLQRLASLLQARVRVRLYNLTRGRQADVQARLALLTLGCRAGDLCQLVMSGVDAELATLVFSAWVNEQGELLNGRHPDFTTSRQRLAQVAPDLCFTPAMLASLPAALQPATVDKPALLQQLLAQGKRRRWWENCHVFSLGCRVLIIEVHDEGLACYELQHGAKPHSP